MATNPVRLDEKEVAIEQLDLHIEAIDDGRRRLSIVFPPVPKVRELSGQRVQTERVTFNAEALTDTEQESVEAEFERLYAKYDRFRDSPTFVSRLAVLAKLSGRDQLAVDFSQQAGELSDSHESQFRSADARLVEDRQGAESELRELANSEYIPAKLRLAELAILREDWNEAQNLIDSSLEADFQDWRIHLVAGTMALRLGRYPEAVHHFRIAQEDRPRSATIYLNIAIAQYAQGNVKKSIQAARSAVALSPFKESALVFWADVLINENMSSTGVLTRQIERFLEHQPESSAVAERAANLYLLAGAASHGIEVLRRLRKEHSATGLLNNIGVLFWSENKLAPARHYFASAIKNINPRDENMPLVVANAVSVMLESGDAEFVEQVAKPFLTAFPMTRIVSDRSLGRIFGTRTEALLNQREYKNAITEIEEALGLSELAARLKAMLTSQLVCYFALVEGEYDLALKYANIEFDASKEVGEEGLLNSAMNNLAFVLIELEQLEEARDLLGKLQPNLKEPAIVFATRGLYQIRTGAVERGETNYRKAIAAAKSSALQYSLRKKLNLELSKYWKAVDKSKSLRYARTAQKVKSSETGWDHKKMRAEINSIITELTH